jgi:hypothetical protein
MLRKISNAWRNQTEILNKIKNLIVPKNWKTMQIQGQIKLLLDKST